MNKRIKGGFIPSHPERTEVSVSLRVSSKSYMKTYNFFYIHTTRFPGPLLSWVQTDTYGVRKERCYGRNTCYYQSKHRTYTQKEVLLDLVKLYLQDITEV